MSMIASSTRQSLEFKADTTRLLRLMVHSLYTQNEIFLRELISNASDALDRFHVEALTQPDWTTSDRLEIGLEVDRQARTLTVRDNGIGMRGDEIVEYLGTIARSMTHVLPGGPKDHSGSVVPPQLIGQFGVGFYSSFMVASRVVVLTRHPGESDGVRWECDAESSQYTIETVDKPERGTSVTLFLKPADPDGGMEDFTDPWVLRGLVKRHSDFISYPILLRTLSTDVPPDDTPGADGARGAEAPLNSMKPIWTRPAADVSDDEYNEFYKHVSHAWSDPLLRLGFKAEGRSEYQALVFVPAEAPRDLYYHAAPFGLQLYARRVMVMERCEELLPRYLRFIKGIVDATDLPLHISRQMLQEHRHVSQIRRWLTRKVLDALGDLQQRDVERYRQFWKTFGRVLKEGVGVDSEQRDRLIPRLLFESSDDPAALTTLAGYVERAQPDQTEIYYMTGDSREMIELSPHLEAFRERRYEILYLSDPVDELVVESLREFDGKRLRSVSKGTPALGGEEERKAREAELEETTKQFTTLLETLRCALDAEVRAVRLSPRLVDAPACLAGEEFDHSPRLERQLLKGNGGGPRQRRILEINPRHPIALRLQALLAAGQGDTPLFGQCARLLHGYALLAEGSPLTDHAAFIRALTEVVTDRLTPA